LIGLELLRIFYLKALGSAVCNFLVWDCLMAVKIMAQFFIWNCLLAVGFLLKNRCTRQGDRLVSGTDCESGVVDNEDNGGVYHERSRGAGQ